MTSVPTPSGTLTQDQAQEFIQRAHQELGPMIGALWNYWSQQESMTAEDAIKRLVREHTGREAALRQILLAPPGEVREQWRSVARQALAQEDDRDR